MSINYDHLRAVQPVAGAGMVRRGFFFAGAGMVRRGVFFAGAGMVRRGVFFGSNWDGQPPHPQSFNRHFQMILVHNREKRWLWVHDPGCLHDPSAHAHNDVVESAHAQMTILFCDDLRHCTICSTLAHLSLLSSVNTIEGIIFLI